MLLQTPHPPGRRDPYYISIGSSSITSVVTFKYLLFYHPCHIINSGCAGEHGASLRAHARVVRQGGLIDATMLIEVVRLRSKICVAPLVVRKVVGGASSVIRPSPSASSRHRTSLHLPPRTTIDTHHHAPHHFARNSTTVACLPFCRSTCFTSTRRSIGHW